MRQPSVFNVPSSVGSFLRSIRVCALVAVVTSSAAGTAQASIIAQGSRICDTDRNALAAKDTDYTLTSSDQVIIYAGGVNANDSKLENESDHVWKFRRVGGTWAAITTTSEVKLVDSAALMHGTILAVANRRATEGDLDIYVSAGREFETSGFQQTAIGVDAGRIAEAQVALNFADAPANQQYEFACQWDDDQSPLDIVYVARITTPAVSALPDPQGGAGADRYATEVLALGPLSYWRLGETVGATAVDETGTNDGTYMGPTLGVAGGLVGDADPAAEFDGVNDYVATGTFDVSGPGLTLSAWVSLRSAANDQARFVSKATDTAENAHTWMLSTYRVGGGDLRLRGRIMSGGVTNTLIASSGHLELDRWYFAVLTYDGSDMLLYLDGVRVGGGSHSVGGPVDAAPTVANWIGGNSPDPTMMALDGRLDDVAIFERALAVGEVRALHAAGRQYYTVAPGMTLAVGPLAGTLTNDTDPEGDALTVSLVSGPSQAAAFSLNADGSFQYTADALFSGTDSFVYQACDAGSDCGTATVTITAAGASTYQISGRVFEDDDFAGTGTGWDGGVGDAAQPGVDVELYTARDTYLTSTTTDATGMFTFTAVGDGSYKVRVRAATLGDADTPPVDGLNPTVPATWPYPLPEMTWGRGSPLVGGRNAAVDDASTGDDAGPGDNWVPVDVTGIDVAGVDFGFAYDVIANTVDDGAADGVRGAQGSLRQFFKNSNAIGGVETSHFAIPVGDPGYVGAGGYWSIRPVAAALPTLVDRVVLDAYNQPGAAAGTQGFPDALDATPRIEIDGTLLAGSGVNGLTLSAGNSTVRGLVINSFTGAGARGIAVTTNGGNTIQGNFVGTDITGTIARSIEGHALNLDSLDNLVGGPDPGDGNIFAASTTYGVWIVGSNNRLEGNFIGTDITGTQDLGHAASGVGVISGTGIKIGGSAAGAGNLISGNTGNGIWCNSSPLSLTVQGNRIGTDITGTVGVGNGGSGILVNCPNTTVGGTEAGESNLISGNLSGVSVAGSGGGTVVTGNLIGTDASGTGVLGNTGNGVLVNTSNVTIGGTAAGAGNVIANSGQDNVVVNGTATNVRILGNSVYGSGALAANIGIDLGTDGVTDNDDGDGDTGPNNLQNYPVLTSAVTDETSTITIAGLLNSAASTVYRVEFFASPTEDGTGHGEGKVYLGGTDVTTNVDGDVGFSAPLPRVVAAGEFVSATATDPAGNTSEFAANMVASLTPPAEISGVVFEDADFAGTATDFDGGIGDAALANVDVELYDASDTYLTSTTTAGDGSFTFAGLADGTYKVRARSATIGDADTAPAGGLHTTVPATWPYPLADMTWGHGSTLIGGQDPVVDDTATGNDAGPGDSWIAVVVSGGDVNGVNLGFCYDLIVNDDDDANADDARSKQGSLRQFIKNSNAIAGTSTSRFLIP